MSIEVKLYDKPINDLKVGTPYRCKNCGDSGRIITTSTMPKCPGCGRHMKYETVEPQP